LFSLPFSCDGVVVGAVEQAAAAFVKWMDHIRPMVLIRSEPLLTQKSEMIGE
jgi:hypothetical protein